MLMNQFQNLNVIRFDNNLISKHIYMNQEEYNRLMIELMKQIIKNQSDIISMLKVKSIKGKNNRVVGCTPSNR
jgi:hypothetical protein